ncbi:hypothetical protein QTN25_005644 [Entamoeba marina]
MQKQITHLLLLTSSPVPKILYTTSPVDDEMASFIATSSFPDKSTKLTDYLYFNTQSYYGISTWKDSTFALVAITTSPYFHQISHHLINISKGYILQTKAVNEPLLKSYWNLLNNVFTPTYSTAPTVTSLLNRLDNHLISLIKLYLLEYKVLIVASKEQAALVSETILMLQTLIPGVMFPLINIQNEKSGKKSEAELLCYPLAINTATRPVYFHISLSNISKLAQSRGIFAGMTTDLVLTKSPDYDVVVDLSTNKIISRDRKITKIIEPTKTDNVFIYNLKQKLFSAQSNESLIELEHYLFNELSNYVYSFFNGLARNKNLFTMSRVESNARLNEVFTDFSEHFTRQWLTTDMYMKWKEQMVNKKYYENNFYERVHPAFAGKISTTTKENLKTFFRADFFVSGAVSFQKFNNYITTKVSPKVDSSAFIERDNKQTSPVQFNQSHSNNQDQENVEESNEENEENDSLNVQNVVVVDEIKEEQSEGESTDDNIEDGVVVEEDIINFMS